MRGERTATTARTAVGAFASHPGGVRRQLSCWGGECVWLVHEM